MTETTKKTDDDIDALDSLESEAKEFNKVHFAQPRYTTMQYLTRFRMLKLTVS